MRKTSSLARHYLCAVPQLTDPNFRRSVILMLEHEGEGALGLIVNNVLPNTLADVVDGLGMSWHGDPDVCVRVGGPVEPMKGWILHDQFGWDATAEELLPGVLLTTSLEPVIQSGRTDMGRDGSRVLFLLGYAGWGENQLEAEIAMGSWVAVPIRGVTSELDGVGIGVEPDWLFTEDADEMWASALRSIGVDPGRLVGLHGDAAMH